MAEKQSTSKGDTSITVTVTQSNEETSTQQEVSTVRLKLRKPKSRKKVNWTEGTVDNEHMDKKKSKCCCIYKKPRGPEDSSSTDSDDECEHCHGHVEKKKKPPEDPNCSEPSNTAPTISSLPENPNS